MCSEQYWYGKSVKVKVTKTILLHFFSACRMFVIRKILKLNLRLFIMYKLKELFLMFILAFVSLAAYAQSLTVTGKVIDSEGYEVIGGSVTIKGVAGVGTVTDVMVTIL